MVNIPANPRDVTLNECLYALDAIRVPIAFEELIKKVCDKDQYSKIYIGNDLRIRANIKLRTVLEMLLQNSHVARIQMKPVVLQWISNKSEAQDKKEQCDPCDPCDIDKTPSTTENTTSNSCKQVIIPPKWESKQQITGSHESHESHRPIPSIAYEAQVIRKILSNNEQIRMSYGSHPDYNFDLVDKSIIEIPMGLNKD